MPCHAEIAGKSQVRPKRQLHFKRRLRVWNTSPSEPLHLREVKRTGRGQGEIPTLLNIIDDNKSNN